MNAMNGFDTCSMADSIRHCVGESSVGFAYMAYTLT